MTHQHSRSLRARLSDETGMTLIELVVACGILIVVIAGAIGAQAMATSMTENNGHLGARTAEYAVDKMEQLLELTYGDAQSNTTVFPSINNGGTRAGRRRKLQSGCACRRLQRLSRRGRQHPVLGRDALYRDAAGQLVLQAGLAGVGPVVQSQVDYGRRDDRLRNGKRQKSVVDDCRLQDELPDGMLNAMPTALTPPCTRRPWRGRLFADRNAGGRGHHDDGVGHRDDRVLQMRRSRSARCPTASRCMPACEVPPSCCSRRSARRAV